MTGKKILKYKGYLMFAIEAPKWVPCIAKIRDMSRGEIIELSISFTTEEEAIAYAKTHIDSLIWMADARSRTLAV